jgi:hypothetical protein
MDEGGLVTLVFYKLQDKWWKEPTLNLLAAACQMSSFTHVELAIGSDPGAQGQMTNVCRVFNDAVGVEVMSRTGKNPQYAQIYSNPARVPSLVQHSFRCGTTNGPGLR